MRTTESRDVWLWPASTVTRVIDGDTFVARVSRDLGFHGTAVFDVRLRLAGVNAPPAKTVDGIAATAELGRLLLGEPVDLETVGPYKYGDEWMATARTLEGLDVAQAMIDGGFAVAWDGTGPRPGG